MSSALQSTALWQLSAAQTAVLVQQGEVSAREVAESALARVEAVNGTINAIVECRPDDVLSQADRIDADRAAGRPLGPLAGVPVTIKVITDQAGYATTNGIKSQKDLIAETHAPLVKSFVDDGAILLGRTNTPAFSYRWFTNNALHGHTLNPRNPALTPGGSSGGAASAVAAGLGAIGHGTDIAGSVRYPAYACGVHGLRPTLGRVPTYNSTWNGERGIGSQIMSVSGPIARTVNDLRLALDAMARPTSMDPWYMPVPLTGAPVARRAAVCLRPDGLDTAPEICEALLASAEKLRDAGWTVDEVDTLPALQEGIQIQVTLWLGDGYEALVAAAEAEGDAGAIAVLKGQHDLLSKVGLPEFAAALKGRNTMAREWQRYLLEQYPVVLMPVSGDLPFADQLDLKDPESYKHVWQAQMPMIALPVTGVPGLTLTTGMVNGNVPVGIQIVAARFREDLCLAAAEAIEARTAPLPVAMT